MPNQEKRSIMGRKLAQVRKAHRLTQEQVADILKIKRSTYAYYERNITPTLENIRNLSTLFAVSTHELMYDEMDPITLQPPPSPTRSDRMLQDAGSIFSHDLPPSNFGQLYVRERELIGYFRLLPENLKDRVRKEVEELYNKNEQ